MKNPSLIFYFIQIFNKRRPEFSFSIGNQRKPLLVDEVFFLLDWAKNIFLSIFSFLVIRGEIILYFWVFTGIFERVYRFRSVPTFISVLPVVGCRVEEKGYKNKYDLKP